MPRLVLYKSDMDLWPYLAGVATSGLVALCSLLIVRGSQAPVGWITGIVSVSFVFTLAHLVRRERRNRSD